MDEMLVSSRIWKIMAAIGAWLTTAAASSRVVTALQNWTRSSTCAQALARALASPARATQSSRLHARLTAVNARLASAHPLRAALDHSLPGRIWQAVVQFSRNSRLLSWLFSGGLHGAVLSMLALYVLIDHVLRDLLAVPVLSSVWDEGLVFLAVFAILYARTGRKHPLAPCATPQDIPVLIYAVTAFVLMLVVSPFFSIQIAGFRAAVQYLVWFFLIVRLLRSERDFLRVYLLLVLLAAAISLHGIYQYIIAVPIPESWTTHTETAVRTRVYSIFGSPNIMGDFMVLCAPMAAALAYYVKDLRWKAAAWTAAICMCFGCLFTMSRGAWMAMAVAIVLFILLVDRRLLAPLIVAGAAACLLPFVRSRIGFLFTPEFREATAAGGRARRKFMALSLLHNRGKAAGAGLGMFGGAVAVQNQVLDFVEYTYVDNYYLKVMTETGYIGLGAYLIMLGGLVVNGLRTLRRTALRMKNGLDCLYPLCAAIFSGLCGVLIHCLFENIFEEPYMMAYFWTLAGMLMWAGFLRPERKEFA